MTHLNALRKINVKQALLISLFLLPVLFTTGCITHFEHALSAPGQQELDMSVCGTWFMHKDKESVFIHIGKEYKTGLLTVVMVEYDSQDEIEISQWSGHTSRFDKADFLNLKEVVPKEKADEGYLFVKYQVINNYLHIYLMDDTIVEDAVKNGTLKGQMIKDKWSSSAYVTQDQNKLQQFILANSDRLFKESEAFPRLKSLMLQQP